MKQVHIFPKEEVEKAVSVLRNFLDMLSTGERTRIQLESSSEFSTETSDIRGFYFGYVLPNAAEAIIGEKRIDVHNDKKKLYDIHVKLKMLVLPRRKYHIIIDGKPVEKEGVGSLKNATVREWFVFITAVMTFLEEHWGVDLNQRDHENYTDFAVVADRLKDNFNVKQSVAKHRRRFEKNMKSYGGTKPKNGT